MPVPEGEELFREIQAIVKLGLFPAEIIVYDKQTQEEIDRYLVGCYVVPRVGEVIDYGETKLGVFGVRHKFVSQMIIPGTTIRIQKILVAGYEE